MRRQSLNRAFCWPEGTSRSHRRGFLLLCSLFVATALVSCAADPGPAALAIAGEPVPVLAPEASSPPQAVAALPESPLSGRVICIDPGHEAVYTPGATARTRSGVVPRHLVDGIVMTEHELTLSVATRLEALLEADGAQVCVTRKAREAGGGLQQEPADYTGDGRVRPVEDVPEIIQPRIDWANDFGAEVLLSIHFNGSEDPSVRGSEVYYTDAGPRAGEGRTLAQSVLTGLLSELTAASHRAVDRGVRSDRYQRYSDAQTARMLANNAGAIRANGHDPAKCGDCYRLLTLGNNPMSIRMGRYLAVLVEVEFLSNPDVVEGFLLRPDSPDVIAAGLHQGLVAYFAHG
jgi:N-acetylmuramoyl-L-alanine amidase